MTERVPAQRFPADGPAAECDHRSITLASAIDLDGFRRACRTLWSAQVAPERVGWYSADGAAGELFQEPLTASSAVPDAPGGHRLSEPVRPEASDAPGSTSHAAPLTVPPAFMSLCQSVILHADPGRFGLLYRLLWRLQREPALRHDPLDADWVVAQQMSQAVRRDLHKMKAFVRFRTLLADGGEREKNSFEDSAASSRQPAGGALHVAWFEPEHHIVEAAAPFFARRFTAMRWAILTPERCVSWDGSELLFEPGADRSRAPPADAGEALWLTYYESIFNPARLKVAMMQKEMPKRYWHNLPEARLIPPLIASAAERSNTMILQGPTDPVRRLPRDVQALPSATAANNSIPHPQAGQPVELTDAAPRSLDALRVAIDRCRECPIGAHATQAVPGEGATKARVMFVGEQPGDQEDLSGRPFVGPAGQLFNRALAELGWPRDAVYVSNAVKHFKYELRGKRRIHKTPSQQEAAACLHWLENEIELVEPEVLVALGATAARQLMGSPIAVTRQRGQWLQRVDGRRVLITLHPSALLRMEPADKDEAYAAWLADLRQAAPFMTRGDEPPSTQTPARNTEPLRQNPAVRDFPVV